MKRRLIRRNKKKRGFTLIELLAVILILGIIALIAIPTVNGVIDQSREGATERTGDTLVNSAETYYTTCMLNNEGCNSNLLTEARTKGKTVKELLGVKGDVPDNKDIVQFEINKDGNVELIYNSGNYMCSNMLDANGNITYTISSSNVISSDGVECSKGNIEKEDSKVYVDGTEIYFNPNTGMKCTKEDADANMQAIFAAYERGEYEMQSESDGIGFQSGIYSGCMRWHSFGDDGSAESVDLLLDNSIAYSRIGVKASTILGALYKYTKDWDNSLIRNDSYSVTYKKSQYDVTSFSVDYSGYKARLLTINDLEKITKQKFETDQRYEFINYSWLFENTRYVYDYEANDGQIYYYSNEVYFFALSPYYAVLYEDPILEDEEEYDKLVSGEKSWDDIEYTGVINVSPDSTISSDQTTPGLGSFLRPVITVPKSNLK